MSDKSSSLKDVTHRLSPRLSTDISSIIKGINLSNQLACIPEFDGRTPPLEDFLETIEKVAAFVTPDQESQFLTAILGRLRGEARLCVENESIHTIAELTSVLKEGLSRSRPYQDCIADFNQLRLHPNESARSLYYRARNLASMASNAWKLDYGFPHPVLPLNKIAVRSFILALPTRLGELICLADPSTLREAIDKTEKLLEFRINSETKHRRDMEHRKHTNPYKH